MRIIAGSARSRTILAPEGRDTRPTLDRVRENLFNILMRRVPEARVLDLFAGSGALSMEALSRGAAHATLVDIDRAAIRCIQQNITALRFTEETRVLPSDWKAAVTLLKQEGAKFDLVFLDPPYKMHDLTEVSQALIPLLAEDALVVVEHEVRTMPALSEGFDMTDTRKYGIVGVSFFRYVGQEA